MSEINDLQQLIKQNQERISYIGPQHPIIQQIRKMRQGRGSELRHLFLLDGMWALTRLNQVRIKIRHFLFCPDKIFSRTAIQAWRRFIEESEASYLVSERLFDKISDRDSPDGMLFLVELPSYANLERLLPQQAFVLVLEGLESPGNIGTILRTCDGAGVDAVLFCPAGARLNHPKLVKSSMGAVLSVPMIEFADAGACRDWLLQEQFNIYLADAAAAMTYQEHTYEGKTALVMGSERYGLSRIWYEDPHHGLAIPMCGISDSLNVGVAASIIIYEIALQRKKRLAGQL